MKWFKYEFVIYWNKLTSSPECNGISIERWVGSTIFAMSSFGNEGIKTQNDSFMIE